MNTFTPKEMREMKKGVVERAGASVGPLMVDIAKPNRHLAPVVRCDKEHRTRVAFFSNGASTVCCPTR